MRRPTMRMEVIRKPHEFGLTWTLYRPGAIDLIFGRRASVLVSTGWAATHKEARAKARKSIRLEVIK